MISRRSLLSGLLSLAALGPLARVRIEEEIHGIDPSKPVRWVSRSEHYGHDPHTYFIDLSHLSDEMRAELETNGDVITFETAAIRRSMGFKS